MKGCAVELKVSNSKMYCRWRCYCTLWADWLNLS